MTALLAAAAIAAAVIVVTRSGGGRGPLVPLIDGKVGVGVVLHLGQSASISGPLIIRNKSGQTLTLDRVEPIGLQNGLDLRGAYILSRPNAIGEAHGYKVPGNGQALPGARVPAHSQVELVIGVKATKLGRHLFTALDVLYHSGGTTYRRNVPMGVAVCAPDSLRTCEPPPLAPPG